MCCNNDRKMIRARLNSGKKKVFGYKVYRVYPLHNGMRGICSPFQGEGLKIENDMSIISNSKASATTLNNLRTRPRSIYRGIHFYKQNYTKDIFEYCIEYCNGYQSFEIVIRVWGYMEDYLGEDYRSMVFKKVYISKATKKELNKIKAGKLNKTSVNCGEK